MWQRLLVDYEPPKDGVEDYTELKLGTQVILAVTEVVYCPNCNRKGVMVSNAIIHVSTREDYPLAVDSCLPDLPEGSPKVVLRTPEGELVNSWNDNENIN